MYIIAGCYAKYRCLTDIYSLDLTPLLESGSTKGLTWIERKPKDISYITRWGHSSAAYDNKIYIFAGRFSNDLNDIWVFDPKANTLKSLKMGSTSNDAPKARRRHCAGFVGSCMIIFGGFNGEYFNDLHYINVFELSNKIDSSLSLE
jgi:N-acetylneuraminic acid mutarotase